jgi:hypothetical protein
MMMVATMMTVTATTAALAPEPTGRSRIVVVVITVPSELDTSVAVVSQSDLSDRRSVVAAGISAAAAGPMTAAINPTAPRMGTDFLIFGITSLLFADSRRRWQIPASKVRVQVFDGVGMRAFPSTLSRVYLLATCGGLALGY